MIKVTVFKTTAPDGQVTHLHLPNTSWGNIIQERLVHVGHSVQATDRPQFPDTRDQDELARVDAILEWADPHTD